MPILKLRFPRRWPRVSIAAIVLLFVLLGFWSSNRAYAICGGEPVSTDFDFVAALFIGNDFHCGGTVLPGGWILTAAHCGNIQTVVVRRKNVNTPAAADKLPVAQGQCVRHAEFNSVTGENDIALIKLNNLPPGLQGVSLVNAGWKEGGQPFVILGYSKECTHSLQLNQASVEPKGKTKCGAETPSRAICTSTKKGRVGKGDSGGPVLAGGRLAGVISDGWAAHHRPDRHMRVTEYLSWIAKVQAGDLSETKPCGN